MSHVVIAKRAKCRRGLILISRRRGTVGMCNHGDAGALRFIPGIDGVMPWIESGW